MPSAERNESRRNYHTHDRACRCAQVDSFPLWVKGMGSITQKTFLAAKICTGEVKQVLRSQGFCRQINMLKPGYGIGRNSNSWSLPVPKSHCNSNGFVLEEEEGELLLASPSSYPPFLPKMVLLRGYSVHKGSLWQG